jgi:transposase-like protein
VPNGSRGSIIIVQVKHGQFLLETINYIQGMKEMARQFTEQFKKDAIAYVHDHSDLSINACARNLGINSNTLHGWVRKIQREVRGISRLRKPRIR